MKLATTFENFKPFSKQILESSYCIPCATAKAGRGSVSNSLRATLSPLELVQLDISGKMSTKSIGNNNHAVGFVEDFTSKSDVYFIKIKGDLFPSLKNYKMRYEKETNFKLINPRFDQAGENKSNELRDFYFKNAIRLEYSPTYDNQSNGVA